MIPRLAAFILRMVDGFTGTGTTIMQYNMIGYNILYCNIMYGRGWFRILCQNVEEDEGMLLAILPALLPRPKLATAEA